LENNEIKNQKTITQDARFNKICNYFQWWVQAKHFVTWAGLGNFLFCRVRGWFGSALNGSIGAVKFSLVNKKISNFQSVNRKNLFGLGQEILGSKQGQSLIYCGSEVFSGCVRKETENKLLFQKINLIMTLFCWLSK